MMNCLAGILVGMLIFFTSAPSDAAADWGYSSPNDPSVWGKLAPDYQMCARGAAQSPVDLAATVKEPVAPIQFHYGPVPLDATDTSRGLLVSTASESKQSENFLDFDQQRFDLAQFHFHSPSEHQINHDNAAAELHLVHRNAQDQSKLLVVAVLLEQGQSNAELDELLQSIESTSTSQPPLDLSRLLPKNIEHYQYVGSLTTPPCTEGVQWIVMKTPLSLSPKQLDQLHAFVHDNNRPLQPLNERVVLVGS